MTDSLAQRSDLIGNLLITCSIPILQEFVLVLARPLNNHPESTGGKLALKQAKSTNIDNDLVTAIPCMKVRRIMFIIEHGNHNPIKSANLRHSNLARTGLHFIRMTVDTPEAERR